MSRTTRAVVVAVTTALLVTGLAGAPAASATPGALTLVDPVVEVQGPSTNPVSPGCQSVHPPFSDCGYVTVHATVSGFSAFGGISADAADYDQFGGFGGPGSSARLTEFFRCGDGDRVHLRSVRLSPAGIWGGYDGYTNAYTRTSADAARLEAGFEFPNPGPACAGQHVLRAWVSNVRLGFHGTHGAPDQVFRVHGVHAVPLPAA
jgi:hypothetical protein